MELIEELKKTKEKNFKDLDSNYLLDEANKLLLSAASVETDVIYKLGLNNTNSFEKKLKDDFVRTKKAEEIYNQDSFTGKQIKQLCDEYDLRCLHINEFKDSYPPEMLRKINEFAEANNIIISKIDWFIIAPSESFNLKKFTPKTIDPIVLYRTDRNNSGWNAEETDTFVQVYNWGNDFMAHRKVFFMFNDYTSKSGDWSNAATTVLHSLFLILGCILTYYLKTMLFIVLTSIMFYLASLINKNYSINNSQWNTTIY